MLRRLDQLKSASWSIFKIHFPRLLNRNDQQTITGFDQSIFDVISELVFSLASPMNLSEEA
jgi:hypothetical protein